MSDDTNLSESEYIRTSLSTLSYSQFKEFVEEIWERLGYTVEKKSESDDEGYDLVVTRKKSPKTKHLVKIDPNREADEPVHATRVRDLHEQKWRDDTDVRPDIDDLYFITSRRFSTHTIRRTSPTSNNRLRTKLVTTDLHRRSDLQEPQIIDLIDLIDETGSRDWLKKYDLLPEKTPPVEKYRLTMTVVTETGEPVKEALLTLSDGRNALSVFDNGERRGRTNNAGKTRVQLKSGRYTVTATHDGFKENIKEDVTVTDDTEVTLKLERELRTVTIATTTNTGESVSGSVVAIRDDDGVLVKAFDGAKRRKTGLDGRVEAELPGGSYTVTGDHEHFTDNARKDIFVDRHTRKASLVFEDEKRYELTVSAKDEGDDPVAGVLATVRTQDGNQRRIFGDGTIERETDQYGQTTVEIPSGRYTVIATHEGFRKHIEEDITVTDDIEVALRLERELQTVAITTMTNTGESVSGSVVAIRDDNGVLVKAFDGAKRRKTGPNGRVEAELPNGSYTVTSEHENFNDNARKDLLVDRYTRKVSLVFGDEKQYELTISVKDEEDDPVAGALVAVRTQEGNQRRIFDDGTIERETDQYGQTSVDVPSGQYTVTARHENFDRSAKNDVKIDGDGESTILSLVSENIEPTDPDTIWKTAIKANLVLWILVGPALLIQLLLLGVLELSLLYLPFLLVLWVLVPVFTSMNVRKPINLISWLAFPVVLATLVFSIAPVIFVYLSIILWATLPVLTYLDSKEVADSVGWPVYRFNYVVLSLIIGVNIVVAFIYLRRREKIYERYNQDYHDS